MSSRNFIQGINTERIRWVLNELHLDAGGFGPKVSMPNFDQKLSDGVFTFNQLQKIATKLGYGVLFFMEQGLPDGEKVHSAHYRTLANQNIAFDANLSKLIKQVEKHRDVYISLLEELEEPVMDFEPPQLIGTMKEKAQTVRRWLGLGLSFHDRHDFDDYRKRILDKGILVFQSTGYQGKWQVKNNAIDGFAINYPKAPLIFIVKGNDGKGGVFKSKGRQSFTLFHELAHILLHKQDRIDSTHTINDEQDAREREANQFAGLCLVPDEIIANLNIPDAVGDYEQQFKDWANQIGVSVEVIVRRLLNDNKITKKDYEGYVAWYGEYSKSFQPKGGGGMRHRDKEPIHIFGAPYVRAVLSGLAERHITLNKASDYLDGLRIPDIKKLSGYLRKLQEHLRG